MDNLAHTLCGLTLAEAGPRRRWGGAASLVLVVGANAPDVDVVASFVSREHYIFTHRGITHSLPGLLPLAVIVALLCRLVTPLKAFGPLLGLAVVGIASHDAMDLITSWGTQLLTPFSAHRYAWDWVAIIDPWVWGVFALGLVAGVARPERREAAARMALAGVLAYVLACGVIHAAAVVRFRAALMRVGVPPARVEVDAFPKFLNPFEWNATGRTAAGTYQGSLHVLRGLEGRLVLYFRRDPPRAVDGPFAREYLDWARVPVVRLLPEDPARAVALLDLRFAGRADGLPFVVKLTRPAGEDLRREWMPWGTPLPGADQEFELPR